MKTLRTRSRVVVLAVAAVMALPLSACGSDETGSVSDSSSVEVTHNDADVMFVSGMIPHHEQAVTLSSIALNPGRGASQPVVELARQIEAAQSPEIKQMTGWLSEWNVGDGDTMGQHDGMDGDHMMGHGSMAGMASDADIDELRGLNGQAFDAKWLTLMIAHHEGAVEMAQAQLADGQDQRVKDLSNAIIAGQQAEITTMRELRKAIS